MLMVSVFEKKSIPVDIFCLIKWSKTIFFIRYHDTPSKLTRPLYWPVYTLFINIHKPICNKCKLFMTHYHLPHFSFGKIILKNHMIPIRFCQVRDIYTTLIHKELCTSSEGKQQVYKIFLMWPGQKRRWFISSWVSRRDSSNHPRYS